MIDWIKRIFGKKRHSVIIPVNVVKCGLESVVSYKLGSTHVIAETKWKKKQTDLRDCDYCGSEIYSFVYNLRQEIDTGKDKQVKVIASVCESCKEMLDK